MNQNKQSCYICRYFKHDLTEFAKARLTNSTYKASCMVKGYQHTDIKPTEINNTPTLGSKCDYFRILKELRKTNRTNAS